MYENRYVLWAHLRWGRMKEVEVDEDTEKADRFDRWLSANASRLAPA